MKLKIFFQTNRNKVPTNKYSFSSLINNDDPPTYLIARINAKQKQCEICQQNLILGKLLVPCMTDVQGLVIPLMMM